jgi:hypothetical protein
MPGGENMVAFTRILHRTVPDCLMKEVPTFHVWDVVKPQCDGWCDYPVANRPNAIMQFFRAAAKDPNMIKVGRGSVWEAVAISIVWTPVILFLAFRAGFGSHGAGMALL